MPATRRRALDHVAAATAGVLSLSIAGARPTVAEDFPRQPIKLIVPFVAGGGVDVAARIVTPRLGAALGQPVIVENRGGAGGALGAMAVAQAAPDGHTLLLGTGSTHGTNSAVNAKLSYDPVKDFSPVVLVSESPLVLVATPSLGVVNVRELIEVARKRRGDLNFGSYGPGSITHLAAELFNGMAEIEARHVPYRGSAPALVDLIGGRLDYLLDGVSTSLGYIEGGSLKLLGVASGQRTPLLPDAPTIAEQGLTGYDTSVWFGIFAPAGTPKSVVDLVNAKTNAVLAEPDLKAGFARLAFEPQGGTPQVLADRVSTELAKWAALVRERHIQIQP